MDEPDRVNVAFTKRTGSLRLDLALDVEGERPSSFGRQNGVGLPELSSMHRPRRAIHRIAMALGLNIVWGGVAAAHFAPLGHCMVSILALGERPLLRHHSVL